MRKKVFTLLAIFMIASVGCSKVAKDNNDGERTDKFAKPKAPPAVAEMPFAAPAVVTGSPVVGEMAPEIEGADTDGVQFKLSDYRGKVVMIDFWGDW